MKISSTLLRNILWMIFSLVITATILGSFTYLYLDSQLPDVDALKEVQLPVPLRVYTSDGQLLAEFGEISRNPVPYNQVPPLLVKALLATEDQRFFEHSGVDVFGLMRATGELLLTGTKSQGGSTITMQVARNFYLTRKKTFIRKITEILLSLKIERELSKEQILELYLNKIYLGNRAYGVDAAAQVYYGKPLGQLTLPELAMIAGLPKAPSTINPLANPIAAKDRRDHVLARMHDLGEINDKTYQAAISAPLTATYHGPEVPVHAPYVAEMVRDMMITSFGDDAYSKGYSVYTTINSQQQQAGNQALRNALLAYDKRHGYRGAEHNLGAYSAPKMQKWQTELSRMPSINYLQPAAVISVADKSITALLNTGGMITLPWQGLAWAAPEQKNGWPGRAPKSAHDIVKVGDIIRVQQQNNIWQLAQVPQVEGALIALAPQTGAISALVGGFDFRKSKFNRVTQAQRQPGSGFKPFIYAAALAKGFTLASEFNNAPLVFTVPGQAKLWRPQNDDHSFGGPTRLRFALAQSINLVSVRVLQAIGVPYAISYIERFGFDKKQLPANLTLALGTADVTPLQMARGYAVFANGGYRINPFVIDHITNNQGQTVYQAQPKAACENNCDDANADSSQGSGRYAPRAIPVQTAFLMTSALLSVTKNGTGYMVDQQLGRSDLAGKTGTTNDNIDTWFTGFNSDIVASTWVGFDQPSSVHEFGSRAALPMWIDFMKVALAGKAEHTLAIPAGIVTAQIDQITGLLAPAGDPNAMPEYFRNDTVPQQQTPPVVAGAPGAAVNNSEPLF
jgi:penicillin-binding protein 1A